MSAPRGVTALLFDRAHGIFLQVHARKLRVKSLITDLAVLDQVLTLLLDPDLCEHIAGLLLGLLSAPEVEASTLRKLSHDFPRFGAPPAGQDTTTDVVRTELVRLGALKLIAAVLEQGKRRCKSILVYVLLNLAADHQGSKQAMVAHTELMQTLGSCLTSLNQDRCHDDLKIRICSLILSLGSVSTGSRHLAGGTSLDSLLLSDAAASCRILFHAGIMDALTKLLGTQPSGQGGELTCMIFKCLIMFAESSTSCCFELLVFAGLKKTMAVFVKNAKIIPDDQTDKVLRTSHFDHARIKSVCSLSTHVHQCTPCVLCARTPFPRHRYHLQCTEYSFCFCFFFNNFALLSSPRHVHRRCCW